MESYIRDIRTKYMKRHPMFLNKKAKYVDVKRKKQLQKKASSL